MINSKLLDLTLREIIELAEMPKHPTQKYDRRLTQNERMRLHRAKKKAEKMGEVFDSHEWIAGNLD